MTFVSRSAASPGTALAQRVALTAHASELDAAAELLRSERQKPRSEQHPELPLLAAQLWAGAPAEQLTHFNDFLATHGLPGLRLRDDRAPLGVLNVQASMPLPMVTDGPLVSVLMTSFNSASRVDAAVESLLEQTWQGIEIIVVDDASDDDTAARLAAWAARDGRVRPVMLKRNVGTYAAKHVGLQLARGEFITCHDADDWSHPQKIERQLRPLLQDPCLVCTVSCWVRVTDEGRFYARQVFPLMRLNPSSPLFRRELVLQRAGAWDVVRTGADSEFLARIKAVFGPKAVLRIGQPLALGSHRPGSLMTAEDTGYSIEGRSTSRQAYWDAWNHWHAVAKARGASPWLPPNPVLAASHRAFEAPAELQVSPEAAAECMAAQGVPGFMDAPSHRPHWLAHSGAVARIPMLAPLLGGPVLRDGRRASRDARLAGVLAWGRKPSASRASQRAAALHLPVLHLEDGFLRSFRPGQQHPPLSLVLDDTGIYYDSTRPSALERLLQSDEDLLDDDTAQQTLRARQLIQQHGLSKYNHAPALAQVEATLGRPLLRPNDRQRVLVVDQTAGDLSIALGGAHAQTFAGMLAAALADHPEATVYVKTHPETASGRKGGHFAALQDSERTVVLRETIEPLSLLAQMDAVYVVSSTLGFEALLAGKPVTCFGLPWYAGWGATRDVQRCARRSRPRSVDELFAAAYLRYARYLNPETHERGSIFDVIDWLVRQRRMAGLLAADADTAATTPNAWQGQRLIGVGFRRWKQAHLRPMLSSGPQRLHFVPDAQAAEALSPGAADRLLFWGATPPAGVAELAARSGAPLVRIEDGFLRSVGLGSDLIRPRSLVLDTAGIYFDPSTPSALEALLNTAHFSADTLAEAARVRHFIVEHGLTKYNHEARAPARWPSAGRRVVLVPGQVENDASIRLGCTHVRTNAQLLAAARAACPDAFIVYKPHPDVSSGNRPGQLGDAEARRFADHVETRLSVVSCIEACDELHTMTSLSGFDALLRGKRVVVYGQPFYAGWGLTTDAVADGEALRRRQRRLQLDELVAGTLLHHPLYWDHTLKGATSCMAVLRQLQAERDALQASGGLARLRSGWWRRQWRKGQALWEGWASAWA